MKNNFPFSILHSPLLLIFIFIFCFGVYFFTASRDTMTVKQEEPPVVVSTTTSPEIPAIVSFCGNRFELKRYQMREGIDRELTNFTYQHSSTLLLFKRANRLFPLIEPVLKAYGIPDDFKYLAVIESNLDPKAVSPARAVGLWQFLEGTAKNYGLKVANTIDERRHVVKATEAACKYLNDAFAKYGDWLTVAVSYNAGMGRMSEQIQKQHESSVLDMFFVDETTRYPYRILAAKLIFENPYKFGFELREENLYKPINCREIVVSQDIADLAVFAIENGITYLDLKYFNPWLTDTKLLTGGAKYTIQIPKKDELYYSSSNSYVHDKRWTSY